MSELHLSTFNFLDIMATWGRVGIIICMMWREFHQYSDRLQKTDRQGLMPSRSSSQGYSVVHMIQYLLNAEFNVWNCASTIIYVSEIQCLMMTYCCMHRTLLLLLLSSDNCKGNVIY